MLGCFEAAGQGLLQCSEDAMERLLYELLSPLHSDTLDCQVAQVGSAQRPHTRQLMTDLYCVRQSELISAPVHRQNSMQYHFHSNAQLPLVT